LVMVKVRDGGYKLSTLLRSVTLFDGTETQVSNNDIPLDGTQKKDHRKRS
jgi:hypothetical protein